MWSPAPTTVSRAVTTAALPARDQHRVRAGLQSRELTLHGSNRRVAVRVYPKPAPVLKWSAAWSKSSNSNPAVR